MSDSHRLGDLQLAIMRELWRTGESTVAQVHEVLLPSRGLALTTIATMLKKLERKGVVTHRKDGRQFVYRPTIAEDDVHRSMVGELIDRLFAGEPSALVSHLLAEQDIDAAELSQIKTLIAEHGVKEDRDHD